MPQEFFQAHTIMIYRILTSTGSTYYSISPYTGTQGVDDGGLLYYLPINLEIVDNKGIPIIQDSKGNTYNIISYHGKPALVQDHYTTPIILERYLY